jgi:hypothetical protein
MAENAFPDEREVSMKFARAYRKQAALLAVLLTLSIGSWSCASAAAGSDPLVVHAEQTLHVSNDIIDGALQTEYLNRAALAKLSPNIQITADAIRREAPGALRALDAAITTYKANKTADGKVNLETALSVVAVLVQRAQIILAAQAGGTQ